MDDEEIREGRPVKLKSTGELGIIYEVKRGTKYPIRILVEGNKDMQCTKEAIEKVSKRTNIEKLVKGRQEYEKSLGWLGPRTAFLFTGKEVVPVILNPRGKGKTKAFVINHEPKGEFFNLSPSQMEWLFDDMSEAEKRLNKR